MKSIDAFLTKYYKTKNNLRFDGEYLNYLVSLLWIIRKDNLDFDRIKRIRKIFSDKTKWHSSFRGTGLYIISVLLSSEDEDKEKMDRIIDIEGKLVGKGFKESAYLALASYILENREKEYSIEKFIELYELIRNKNQKITGKEDYPLIALLVYKGIGKDDLENRYEKNLNLLKNLEVKSTDVTQDMIISSLIFNDELISNQSLFHVKIESQYAMLYPIFFGDKKRSVHYLTSFEEKLEDYNELQLFMDGSFRRFLSMILILIKEGESSKEDLELVISLCILNFTMAQEHSVLSGSI